MKQRRLLIRQIRSAWRSCISTDYNRRRINSERSLQASFWAALNRRLPENRLIFIEPRISIEGRPVICPDILICNSKQIIAVIELKYQPRVPPSYVKDLTSLATIAKARSEVLVRNDRYLGEDSVAKEYRVAKHTLFVWAGIHADQRSKSVVPVPMFCDGKKCLDGCYLELHAATRVDAAPEVYWRASWLKE